MTLWRCITKFLFAADAVLYTVVLYLFKKNIFLCNSIILSFVIYLCFPILLAKFCLFISYKSIESKRGYGIQHPKTIKLSDNSSLLAYIGFFFVGLSVTDTITLAVVIVLLISFVLLSPCAYFNPVFVLFGYKFYSVETYNGLFVSVISKQEKNDVKDYNFSEQFLYRINRFVYIDHSIR